MFRFLYKKAKIEIKSYNESMKIFPVSFSFGTTKFHSNPEHQFLYTASEFKGGEHSFEHFHIATGMLALIAVLVTLFNLGAKKKVPKNIFVV